MVAHTTLAQGPAVKLPNVRKTREGWNCQFEKSPRTEGGDKVPAVWTQASRQVYLSRCPKSRNLQHFAIREKFSSNFPGTFPEFSSRTPEQTPETATAFSEFSENEVSDFRFATFLTFGQFRSIFIGSSPTWLFQT